MPASQISIWPALKDEEGSQGLSDGPVTLSNK